MKSDIQYYYVGDLSPEIKVRANIESVELHHREAAVRQSLDEPAIQNKWDNLLLTPTDARELAEMLNRAADHCDEINQGVKR